MKKVGQLVTILLLLCVIYQLAVMFFLKEYHYKYTYTVNNEEYKIDEKYKLQNGEHTYNISISDKKKRNYNFLINSNFHKDKEILEDLLVYEKDDLKCVFPVFKNNVYTNVVCNIDKKMVSYDYLKQIGDTRVNVFIERLKKKGYSLSSWTNKTSYKIVTGNNTKISFNQNFISGYNIVVWKYNGVFSINSKKQYENNFLSNDIYDENHYLFSNKNLYVMNIEDNATSFNRLYVVNFKDGKKKVIDMLDITPSTNTYFNGGYKNNIYMLDCNTNTQYKIDDTLEKVSVVSKDNKIKYFDGARLKDKKVDSINNTKIKFYKNDTNFDIKNKYKTDDIRKSNDNYYFKSGDNIYLVFKDDYSNPLLLFSLAGLKDWTVSADSVFGIVGDTMYAYNSEFGLKDIIKYNEFNYHQENMYGVSKNN